MSDDWPKEPRGIFFRDLFLHLIIEHVCHVSLDESGRDGIGGHATNGELACERFGETDQARLAGRIICLARVADEADDAS